MEALAEALASLVEAFVGMLIAVMELMAELLALLCELLFVLVTRGTNAAREQYGRRKEERRLTREAAKKQQADSATATTHASKTRGIVTIVAMLAVVSAGITFYVQHRLRQQRIEETQIQLAAIADDVSQKVRDKVEPLPESGRLADRDAWNRPVELSLLKGVLGSQIVVRSDGPDKQTDTADDIRAYRHVNNSVKEVTGELTRRGVDRVKKKLADFLPGQDNEKSGDLAP